MTPANDAEPLRGRRILVVEDDFLIAQVVVELLEDAGAEVLGPIGRVDEAVTFVHDHKDAMDAAVLDVNLHGVPSYPIADALRALSIGFVFATGYGGGGIERAYRDHPSCQKPFDRRALLSALARAG